MIGPELRPEDEVAWEIVLGTQVAQLRDRVSRLPGDTSAGKAARFILEGLERTHRCVRDGFSVRETCRTSGFCVACDKDGGLWLTLNGRPLPVRPWLLGALFREAGLTPVPDEVIFLEPGLARGFITHSIEVVARDLAEIGVARRKLAHRLKKAKEPKASGRIRGALEAADTMEGWLTTDRAALSEAGSEADLLLLKRRSANAPGTPRAFEN